MRLIVLIIILVSLGACARPVGDFGRASPNIVHDDILPAIGGIRAKVAKEPVSNLNLTDEEREMHDRVWRFLISPHSKDWFYDIVVEWQRTRLLPAQDQRFTHERYYAHLRSQEYASSRVRYVTVLRDIEVEQKTTPGVFVAICNVREIDRRRDVAVNSLESGGADERAAVVARKAENEMFIAWFVRALGYRYASYSLALERLLIETPHEAAREIDARLSLMAIDVERAERGEFCGSSAGFTGSRAGSGIASRFQTGTFSSTPVFRK